MGLQRLLLSGEMIEMRAVMFRSRRRSDYVKTRTDGRVAAVTSMPLG